VWQASTAKASRSAWSCRSHDSARPMTVRPTDRKCSRKAEKLQDDLQIACQEARKKLEGQQPVTR